MGGVDSKEGWGPKGNIWGGNSRGGGGGGREKS